MVPSKQVGHSFESWEGLEPDCLVRPPDAYWTRIARIDAAHRLTLGQDAALLGGVAAVDEEVCAGDVAGLVACKVKDAVAHFNGLGGTLHGRCLAELAI